MIPPIGRQSAQQTPVITIFVLLIITEQPKRQFPSSFCKLVDDKVASYSVQKCSPDGIFNYACAVLNDGLPLLKLRDAIHEGDSHIGSSIAGSSCYCIGGMQVIQSMHMK